MKTACVEVKVNGAWRGTSVFNAEQAIEFAELFRLLGYSAEATLHPNRCISSREVSFEQVVKELFNGNWPK